MSTSVLQNPHTLIQHIVVAPDGAFMLERQRVEVHKEDDHVIVTFLEGGFTAAFELLDADMQAQRLTVNQVFQPDGVRITAEDGNIGDKTVLIGTVAEHPHAEDPEATLICETTAHSAHIAMIKHLRDQAAAA